MPDATPPPKSSANDLARSAIAKRMRGEKLTRAEQSVLARVQAEQEEQLRQQHYRTIPKKHWVQMSGRQHKTLAEQAELYGIPLDGPTIDLFAVARWLHDWLAEHGRDALTPQRAAGETDDGPMQERVREERWKLLRLERLEREGQLVNRHAVHTGLAQIAALFRGFGDTLERAGHTDLRELFNKLLSDCERATDQLVVPPLTDPSQEPADEPSHPGEAGGVLRAGESAAGRQPQGKRHPQAAKRPEAPVHRARRGKRRG